MKAKTIDPIFDYECNRGEYADYTLDDAVASRERFATKAERETAIQRAMFTLWLPATLILLCCIVAFVFLNQKSDVQAARGETVAPGFHVAQEGGR